MNNNVTPENNPIVASVVPFAWYFLCAGMGLTTVIVFGPMAVIVWASIYLFVPNAIAKLNHAKINNDWLYLGLFGVTARISLAIAILVQVIWFLAGPIWHANHFAAVHFGWHLYYLWFILWPGSIFFAVAWFIWRMIQSRNQHKVSTEIGEGGEG